MTEAFHGGVGTTKEWTSMPIHADNHVHDVKRYYIVKLGFGVFSVEGQ